MQTSFWFEKNSDLHLIKMQIHFFFKEKFKSTSNEDADPFYWKKFRSTSKEDADSFYFEEKFRFTFNEDADLFLVLRKIIDYMQIFEIKKEIITIIKDSRSCFNQNNN